MKFKCGVLAVLCAGSLAQGAVITSGTIVFNQPNNGTSASNISNLILSDGITFSGPHGSDGPLSPSCTDYGAGCQLPGLSGLAIGPANGFVFGFSGVLFFTYPSLISVTPGVKSYSLPFSSTGMLSYTAPPPGGPCQFQTQVAAGPSL